MATKKTETRPATGHINPFGLRMQADLRARLEEAARKSGRSLNAEVVARLERSLEQEAHTDVAAEILHDELYAAMDRKHREALKAIDTSTVDGMVEWLDLFHSFKEEEDRLERMIAEAERRRANRDKKALKDLTG